ncbi:MAG: hypothetical protein IJY42_00800 [Clostridia bacterium]|nr:hypothetical protein [Clostridia bacterium]
MKAYRAACGSKLTDLSYECDSLDLCVTLTDKGTCVVFAVHTREDAVTVGFEEPVRSLSVMHCDDLTAVGNREHDVVKEDREVPNDKTVVLPLYSIAVLHI